MSLRAALALAAVAAVTVPAFAAGLPFQRPVTRTPVPLPQCRPDPGIVSLTVKKLGPPVPGRTNEIVVSYIVRNFGTQWHDVSGRAGMAILTIQDGTGRTSTAQQYFPRDAAPGAIMVSSMGYRFFANFGSDEFVGHIALSLRYDPDDAGDGNPCNNDNSLGNNELRIGGSELTGFMSGAAPSRTFTP